MRTLIVLALAGFAAHSAAADALDEVRCREIGFSRATEVQDMAAFRSFIDADARFVSSSVLRGVDDIAAACSVFFGEDGPSIKWRPQVVEVLEDGKLALSRGPYRVTTKDAEGNPVEQWGTYNSVWRLHDDGRWRIVFDAGSPAASPPDEATQALLEAEDAC
jgi:ketosteroid isomerase-like protein